jgi:TolA-binding protein
MQLLREIIAKHPHDLDAHWGLGFAFKRKGQFREAIYQFRAALPPDGYAPNGHLEIAEALEKINQPQAAAAEYRIVVRQAPNTEVADTAQKALKRLQGH